MGRPPLRSDQKRRGAAMTSLPAPMTAPPEPDPQWSSRALALWEAIKASPTAVFYMPSDWELARLACAVLDDYFDTRRVTLLAELRYIAGLLLLTEADRRRAHLQLEPANEPPTAERPSDVARRILGVAD